MGTTERDLLERLRRRAERERAEEQDPLADYTPDWRARAAARPAGDPRLERLDSILEARRQGAATPLSERPHQRWQRYGRQEGATATATDDPPASRWERYRRQEAGDTDAPEMPLARPGLDDAPEPGRLRTLGRAALALISGRRQEPRRDRRGLTGEQDPLADYTPEWRERAASREEPRATEGVRRAAVMPREGMGASAALEAARPHVERGRETAGEAVRRWRAIEDVPARRMLAHFAASIPVGLAELFAGPLEGIAVLAKELDSRMPELIQQHGEQRAEELATARAAKAIREMAQRTPGLEPRLEDHFWLSQLPRALGSFAGYGLQAITVSALRRGAGTKVAVASATGAGVGRGYAEARASGVDEDRARLAGLASAPAGAVQVVGPLRASARFRKAVEGKLPGGRPHLRAAVSGTIEEAGAEGAGQVGFNAAARLLYDPERSLLEGVPHAVALGGLAGGIAGPAFTGAGALVRGRQGEQAPSPSAEQRQHLGALEGALERGRDLDGQPLTEDGRKLLELTIEEGRRGLAWLEGAELRERLSALLEQATDQDGSRRSDRRSRRILRELGPLHGKLSRLLDESAPQLADCRRAGRPAGRRL